MIEGASARTRLPRRAAVAALLVLFALLTLGAATGSIPAPVVALATGALTIPAIVVLRRRARELERASALRRQRPTENGG